MLRNLYNVAHETYQCALEAKVAPIESRLSRNLQVQEAIVHLLECVVTGT